MASLNTGIEWTDVTWSPIRGCAPVSEGCRFCYAQRQAHRFSGPGQPYAGLTEIGPQGPRWTGQIRLVPEALDAPRRWKKPRKIFVNSMSDLFHPDVPREFITAVFGVIVDCPQHQFQILSKRPQRMLEFCREVRPPSNAWMVVSIEDQATADERIPILLKTPAAVRGISAEPLLGPVDLSLEWLTYKCGKYPFPLLPKNKRTTLIDLLDWIVIGGESGPGARPCNVAWIRSLVDQCRAAATACFVKQLGDRPYVVEGSREAQEWSASGATGVMDDCGGIHLRARKGGDPLEWPDYLRVREYPEPRVTHG